MFWVNKTFSSFRRYHDDTIIRTMIYYIIYYLRIALKLFTQTFFEKIAYRLVTVCYCVVELEILSENKFLLEWLFS